MCLEKGKLQNVIRNTEKNKTKQTEQAAKTKQKMQLYEKICKQTMRL